MSNQTQPYAASTVAMSAYNAIATCGGRAGQGQIFNLLRAVQHPDLEEPLLGEALERLTSMRYVECSEGEYRLRDPFCRIFVKRDLSDIVVEDGVPVGGWRGWMFRDPGRGMVPVEEVIR